MPLRNRTSEQQLLIDVLQGSLLLFKRHRKMRIQYAHRKMGIQYALYSRLWALLLRSSCSGPTLRTFVFSFELLYWKYLEPKRSDLKSFLCGSDCSSCAGSLRIQYRPQLDGGSMFKSTTNIFAPPDDKIARHHGIKLHQKPYKM